MQVLRWLLPFVLSCASRQPPLRSEGLIGLAVGQPVASFVPWHVSGPHAGKTACPLYVYGQRPGVALWVRGRALAEVAPLARALDETLSKLGPRDAVGYVVSVPERNATREGTAQALRAVLGAEALRRVFLTVADTAGNAADLAAYRLADAGTVSLLGYVNRTAAFLWHAPDAAQLACLEDAMRELVSAQEPSAEQAVRLCGTDEPGEPLEVFGRVLDEHGQPFARASVIAYATDASGLYVPPGTDRKQRTPRLRGVAITDEDGFYRFALVKPGPYPHTDDPAHVHLHIDGAMHAHTYRTLWFEGDPRITAEKRAALDGETVIVPLRKRDDGVWTCRLDVRLEGS